MKLAALIQRERMHEITVRYTAHDPERNDLEILDSSESGARRALQSDTRGRILIIFDSRAARAAGFRAAQIGGVEAACDALTREEETR